MTNATIDRFFQQRSDPRQLFDVLSREIDRLGAATMRVSKSQIAFRRKRNFAVVWMPGQYLKDYPTAPLVLTLSFPKPDPSPRWKEVVRIGPKRFTHHLELYRKRDIDAKVRRWLRSAWEQAA